MKRPAVLALLAAALLLAACSPVTWDWTPRDRGHGIAFAPDPIGETPVYRPVQPPTEQPPPAERPPEPPPPQEPLPPDPPPGPPPEPPPLPPIDPDPPLTPVDPHPPAPPDPAPPRASPECREVHPRGAVERITICPRQGGARLDWRSP